MIDRNHFVALDGMRGILAFVVMLHHFGLNAFLAQITGGWLNQADWNLCVDFFFTLSGFVLCKSYSTRSVPIKQYFVKRILRLAPMYYLTLIISFFISGAPFSSFDVITNMLMFQPLLGVQSINPPAWSIPYEMFVPLGIVLSGPRLLKVSTKNVVGCIFLLVILGSIYLFVNGAGNNFGIVRPLVGISAGACLYVAYIRLPPLLKPGLAETAFMMGLAGMLLTAFSALGYVLFYVSTVTAIYAGALARGVLATAPFQALGRWSYSIYLLHFLIMTSSLHWFGTSVTSGNVVLKLLWVGGTILLAAVAYRWIEAPFIRIGSRCTRDSTHALP